LLNLVVTNLEPRQFLTNPLRASMLTSKDVNDSLEEWAGSLNHPESWWGVFRVKGIADKNILFKELGNATERFSIDSFRKDEGNSLLNIWLAFLELH
jgi:hypothetical protein